MTGLFGNIKKLMSEKYFPLFILTYLLLVLIFSYSQYVPSVFGFNPVALLAIKIISYVAFTFFFTGFNLYFIHKLFDDSVENKLPEWDIKFFKIGLNAFPFLFAVVS